MRRGRVRINSIGDGGTDREEAPTPGEPRTDLGKEAAVPEEVGEA